MPAVVLAPLKVLLLRLGGVGDVLLVTPLIRAILLAAPPESGAREATGKAAPSPPAPPDQPASGWSLF